MRDRILGDREKALEEAYFRAEDSKLIDQLRRRANLDEIATALAEKLRVDDPDLLLKAKALGVTAETASAVFFAPLVQMAWNNGKVSRSLREAVLEAARSRGIAIESPAYEQIAKWLQVPPPDALFDVAVDLLRVGYSVLPPAERDERIRELVTACRQAAKASAGLARFFGASAGISPSQAQALLALERSLRSR